MQILFNYALAQLTWQQKKDIFQLGTEADNNFNVINTNYVKIIDLYSLTFQKLNETYNQVSVSNTLGKSNAGFTNLLATTVQMVFEYADIPEDLAENEIFQIFCFNGYSYNLRSQVNSTYLILQRGYTCGIVEDLPCTEEQEDYTYVILNQTLINSPTIVIDSYFNNFNQSDSAARFYWYEDGESFTYNEIFLVSDSSKSIEKHIIQCSSSLQTLKEYARWFSVTKVDDEDINYLKMLIAKDNFNAAHYFGLTYLRDYVTKFYSNIYTEEVFNLEDETNAYTTNLLYLNQVTLKMYNRIRYLPENNFVQISNSDTNSEIQHYLYKIKHEHIVTARVPNGNDATITFFHNYDNTEKDTIKSFFLDNGLEIRIVLKRTNSNYNNEVPTNSDAQVRIIDYKKYHFINPFTWTNDILIRKTLSIEATLYIIDETSLTQLNNVDTDLTINIGFSFTNLNLKYDNTNAGSYIILTENGKTKYAYKFEPQNLIFDESTEYERITMDLLNSISIPKACERIYTPPDTINFFENKNVAVSKYPLIFSENNGCSSGSKSIVNIDLNNGLKFFLSINLNIVKLNYLKGASPSYLSSDPLDVENNDFTSFDSKLRELGTRIDDIDTRLSTIEDILSPSFSIWSVLEIIGTVSDFISMANSFRKYIKQFSKASAINFKIAKDINSPTIGTSLADDLVECINPKINQNLDISENVKYSSFYDIAHGYQKIESKNKDKNILDVIQKEISDYKEFTSFKVIDEDINDFLISNNVLSTKIKSDLYKVIDDPYIPNEVQRFGVIESYSSPLDTLGSVGKYVHFKAKNLPSTKNFNSNTCIRYPFHTSARMRQVELNADKEWVYTVRYTGIADESILGKSGRSKNVKVGYVKQDYNIKKRDGRFYLELKNWRDTEKAYGVNYNELDVDNLFKQFTSNKLYKEFKNENSDFKWNFIEQKIKIKYANRNLLQSVPIQNEAFFKVVDKFFDANFIDGKFSPYKYNLLTQNCQTYVKVFTQLATQGFINDLNINDEGLLKFINEYTDIAKKYMTSGNFKQNVAGSSVAKSNILSYKNVRKLKEISFAKSDYFQLQFIEFYYYKIEYINYYIILVLSTLIFFIRIL